MRLKDKVAVITGACSGIGLATLELFVAEGARVVAADIHEDSGRALEARFPGQVHFAPCDVTNLAQLKAAIDSAAMIFGGLDILFNNAGSGGTPAGVEAFDAEGWDRTQHLLLRAVAAGSAYAVPHLRARGGGAIVNTSSISALQAGYAPLCYSVAKAAVLHYTRVAATELSALNIRINAVVPGFIATRIFGGMFGMDREQSGALAARVLERSGSANPVGRAGQPADIARAVLFLSEDSGGFVTGTHLVVDGGLTIGPRHSWDPRTVGPMADVLQLSPEQLQALRAKARG
jgi:NAD(P)-dependent dehydrogenase (short-subunit alcohol dehydrogenase family)